MDILEEIDVFLSACQLTQDESNNLVFNGITGCFESKYLADWFVNQINFGWKLWQAAKARAVPDLSELQERIAGHQYYHDEHGHMIVDMDDVVKEISGFDSWKAQAVPEWISVKDNLPPENILVLGMSQTRSNIFNVYNVMALDEFEEAEVTHWMPLLDAPQEPAND